jgi:hypothetical protein
LKPKKSKVPWTKEEDAKLLQMWNEGRSWEYIFNLPSLTGVKGPSGCAVRQNSKSDPVQGLIVLELAYKEGKFWDWIFGKFPDRTLAGVRTRWTMVQRRVNKLPPAGGQQQLKLCVPTCP